MNTIEDASAPCVEAESPHPRRNVWNTCELVISYAMILAVIWTPRPLQRWLYWAAIVWFVFAIASTFPGWKAMGCRAAGFWRTSWVVGVALLLAASAMMYASSHHTLHHPSGIVQWILAFGGYAVWSMAQQFLLQGYFLARLVRLVPSATVAAVTAAVIFSAAHLPNPILTLLTLLWGLAACLVFLKTRNIWPLAMAHAIFGICVAITVPATVLHNMRVGLGYLNYRAPQHLHRNQSDHRVSTVAWVIDETPTRR